MQTSKRFLSIDVLKGLGIIYMLLLHQLIWLLIIGDRAVLRYPQSGSLIYGFSRMGLHFLSMQIPVLAAMTFYLSARKPDFTWGTLLVRVAFLIMLEFGKNLLAWGPGDMFAWDVLPFIALSMVVSYPFLKMPREKAGLACIAGVGAAAVCLSRTFPNAALEQSYLSVIFFGDRQGYHFWPFFPWYALFAVGIILGYLVTGQNKKNVMRSVAVLGFFMVMLSVATDRYFPVLDYQNFWGPSIFKPHPFFVLGVIGMSLVSVTILHRAIEASARLRTFFAHSFLVFFARGILWIYLATVIVGYTATDVALQLIPDDYGYALRIAPVLAGLQFFVAGIIGFFVSRSKKVEYSA